MKSFWYVLLPILSLAMLISSCKTTENFTPVSTQIAFEVVDADILLGGGEEGIEESIVVCNSEAELTKIKAKMNSVNPSTEALDNVEIDFENETIIGCFQPVRPSGGYSLTADSLVQTKVSGEFTFVLHCSVTVPQGNTTSALTQPYVFVKSKKLNGLVTAKVKEKKAL